MRNSNFFFGIGTPFFQPLQKESVLPERHISPKRMQRLILHQMQQQDIGTKAQRALKMQREQQRKEHRIRSREEKKTEQERQFKLRQRKTLGEALRALA